MTALLGELGKRLADKWLTALMLPGLLFVGVAVVAVTLGQAHALEVNYLFGRSRAVQSTGGETAVLAGLGALLASAGAGLAAGAIAAPVRAFWLGRWPPLLTPVRRALVRRRSQQWQRLQQCYAEQVSRAEPDWSAVDALAVRRNRIAQAPPSAPTWIGDRVGAADRRIFAEYALDLASAWPRLWLATPDSVRAELRAARSAFDDATTTAGWGVLYLMLGVAWWPAALAGVGTLFVAWRRGRGGAADLAELAESTVDLHGVGLGVALGLCAADARLTRELGKQITAVLRKGA